MNYLWIQFLFKLDEWTCRRLQNAYAREELRNIKRALKRRNGWKN